MGRVYLVETEMLKHSVIRDVGYLERDLRDVVYVRIDT